MSLETTLSKLEAYGRPAMFRMADGWHVKVDMNAVPKGAEFRMCSDFDHATPTEAADCCLARIHEMFESLTQARRIEA